MTPPAGWSVSSVASVPARRKLSNSALLEAKLTGLLRNSGLLGSAGLLRSTGPSGDQPRIIDSPVGAAAASGSAAYVLLPDGREVSSVGPAILWALRGGHRDLILLCGSHAGDVARRAEAFATTDFSVTTLRIEGTETQPAEPKPIEMPPQLSEGVMVFAPVINASGALAVDDFGRLTAEVVGLEVARVSDRDHNSALPTEPRLEVGVGQADRELHDYVHGALTDAEALDRAVSAVTPLRTPASAAHPLSRVARQRWLRHEALQDPTLLACSSMRPLPPLRPMGTLLGSEPAAAINGDGSVIAVFSVGIDPNLIPEGVDYRLRDGTADSRLVFVVPDRDHHRLTVELASLVPGAEVVSQSPPWETNR